jgi:L-aspartate oxidase
MALQTDVLVIGCGIAGAAAALRLAQDRQRQVLVITRAPNPDECNTRYAQGGIVHLGEDDSPALLAEDVLTAGVGLSLPAAVEVLAEEGPRRVEEVLVEQLGVPFDRHTDGRLTHTLEGGHSVARILHVGDATGRAIEEAMIARLRQLPNVTLLTDLTAVDLITSAHHARTPLAVYAPITCHGAYVLERDTGTVRRVLAGATVLATGGLGRIYLHTTNPTGARGDGVAMAYRAGARVINAEYVQFHPTTLAIPGADNFLISEAVRGEGARLVTPDGRHFMDRHAPRWGDLAPRDVVARAIHEEMITHGYPHVLLDIAGRMSPQHIRDRFPTIHAACLQAGVDITAAPVPVVPAAHYFCGGVLVDLWGRTTLDHLYAVGEVSCTGIHGANRLASTSLLEGLVWGDRAGRDIAGRTDLSPVPVSDIPPWEPAAEGAPADPALVYRDQRSIQHVMWLYVGLSRNTHRLSRALHELSHLWEAIDGFYRATRLSDELIGLRNMAQAAWVVTRAAWHNHTSRGAHYREDSRDQEFANLGNSDESWRGPHTAGG